jgi:uncharacterized surface protein with fasciclin (FAS1) repeats
MKTLKYIIAGMFCTIMMTSASMAYFPVTGEKSIVEIAAGSTDHTTLVTALKAADLVSTLSGKGPFTVFAPTNEAFSMVPKDALASLLKPENKAALSGVLTYHVVSGNVDAATLIGMIKKGNGTALL